MSTTTTWTGNQSDDWTDPANWSDGVPTVDGAPVFPGEVAIVTMGTPTNGDATFDATTVVLDGTQSAAPVLELINGNETFGPGALVADTIAGGGGVFEPVASFDNQGTLLADGPGGILQIDAVTASNSLLRQLWTSEGVVRATNGGLLQIAQPVSTQTSEGSSLPEFDFFQSNGTILADNGGTIQLNYQVGSQGYVIASGGSILVAASPGVSGIFQEYNALLTVPGAGAVYISNGGVVEDAGGIGEPVDFLDTTGTLILDPSNGSVALLEVVNGFRPGDTIEIAGATISAPVYTYGPTAGQPGTLTVQLGGGLGADAIFLNGDYRQDSFQVTPDGQGIVVTGPIGTATVDTVPAAGGIARAIDFGNATVAGLAAADLATLPIAVTQFVDVSGVAALSSVQAAAVVDVAGPSTVLGGSAADETIAAGAGTFAFEGGSGSGSVFAGGGADSVFLPGGGNWLAALGNGADTVVAATGNDTVGTGGGGSYVFLGSGASSVGSGGADTVLGSSGSATISAAGFNSDLAFALGGTLQFVAGAGASTVVAGTSAATLYGGSGSTLMFADGPLRYWGSGGTDTVVGENGSVTAVGGAGGGVFFGGLAGHNNITAGSGPTTAVGGGSGDQLIASGSGGDLFAAGAGAETLTGVASSGANTFFAGVGPDVLAGGSGNTALVAGAGSDLLIGGAGVTLFLFVAGETFGGADTISGFDPSHDFVRIAGYASTEAQTLASAVVSNGSSVLSLSDGTSITFAGVTQLSASSFT